MLPFYCVFQIANYVLNIVGTQILRRKPWRLWAVIGFGVYNIVVYSNLQSPVLRFPRQPGIGFNRFDKLDTGFVF